MLLTEQVAPVHHGSVAVSVLRMESLVESGCVVKKKKSFVFIFLKLDPGGNKEQNIGFLAAETHRLCQQVKLLME